MTREELEQIETYRELLDVEVDDMKSRRERLERSDKLLAERFTAINLTR